MTHPDRLIPKRGEALGTENGSTSAEAVLADATSADTPVVIGLACVRAGLVRSDPQRPLYRQLADMIRKIQAAHHGARLPSERRLAQELRMARVTVRKALANLEHEGIVQRRQGAGTYFVSE